MEGPWLRACAIALLIAGLPGCQDRVRVHGAPAGEEWALLIDGVTETGSADDRLAKGSGSELELENFTGGPGELVALVRDRPPKLQEGVEWTPSAGDVIDVEFSKPISIPLTIWVLAAPFATVRDQAASQVLTAAAILREERMGVEFSAVDFEDATPDGFTYEDFDCSQRADLQEKVGTHPGRVNAYWVYSVSGSPYVAESCDFGSGFVASGKGAGDDLLAHELGHSFGLRHTDLDPGFDDTNVMWAASSVREFLSEGQVFRAHVDPTSVLNWLYAVRPGEPLRDCPHDVKSAACPALGVRAWEDVAGGGQP